MQCKYFLSNLLSDEAFMSPIEKKIVLTPRHSAIKIVSTPISSSNVPKFDPL